MSSSTHKWRIRSDGENPTPSDIYGSNFNTYFTSLKIYHGGNFTSSPGRKYVNKKVTFVDFVDVNSLSYELLSEVIKAMNYSGKGYFYRIDKRLGLDLGLMKLESENDFQKFFDFLFPEKCNQVHRIYVEIDKNSHILTYPTSLKKANPQVMEKLLFDYVFDNPHATMKDAREYLFREYGVWISSYYLMPGLDCVRKKVIAINGDD